MTGDRSPGQSELIQLREEISALRSLPRLSPEFAAWLGRLFAIVETTFGRDSDEMRQLHAISPELPSEFYDSVTERLDSLKLPDKQTNALLTALIREVPQTVFRNRLYQYDDLIAAMIHSLRSRT